MKLSKGFLFWKSLLVKCITCWFFSKWSPLAFKEGFTVFPVLTKPKSRGSIRLRNVGKGTKIYCVCLFIDFLYLPTYFFPSCLHTKLLTYLLTYLLTPLLTTYCPILFCFTYRTFQIYLECTFVQLHCLLKSTMNEYNDICIGSLGTGLLHW
jgi:hypothetical protein